MKMIHYSITAIALLLLNACSINETQQITQDARVTADARFQEDEQPIAYLEELHYLHLLHDYGDDHPLIDAYRNLFEETAAGIKPGSGCPVPKPCDVGNTGNCEAYFYQNLEGMRSFSGMEAVEIEIYAPDGTPLHQVVDGMEVKCPKPKTKAFLFPEPLEGDGFFVVRFVSQYTEGKIVEFEMPFIQQ